MMPMMKFPTWSPDVKPLLMFRTGLETTNLFNHTDDPCKTVDCVMKHVSPPVSDGEWVAFASTGREFRNIQVEKTEKLDPPYDDPHRLHAAVAGRQPHRFRVRRDGFEFIFHGRGRKNVDPTTNYVHD